jgi:DNA invertase Pin-like site-specific DNA recombinase
MNEPTYNQRIRAFVPRERMKYAALSNNLYGYLRVSTDRQVDGTSLMSQELDVRAEVKKWEHTHRLQEICHDVTSGGKTRFDEREGGKYLLGKMRPGDVLIIAKVDRFSRSVVDGLQELRDLWRRGIHVVCLDMGGEKVSFGDNGEIMLFMLLLGAQMENKRRSERAKEAWARVKASGKVRAKPKSACIYGRTKSGAIDWEWREFTIQLKDLYLFAVEKFGYSKCDSRHKLLAKRYELLWWPSYAKTGRAGLPVPIPPDYFLRWFRLEDELNEVWRYDLPLPAFIWREDFEIGRLKPDPKPISCFRPINTPGE